ncbi:flippase-like domain-containing protein [Halomarina ordinaria]|uniref:Flippase-like domain-containing protein n=1 Tax=Halomarina ordinaria TaxID=3033939 RepID=A0ABD5UAY2_9EURY|nr:flippase-like domain-containing protein [Halomarina sp. PSRA2]
MTEVSVVLPAYNEAATIERTVERTLDALASFLPEGSFEVLVAEDGCADRTPEVAARIAGRDRRVRHVHADERLGRGGALVRAFRLAAGETLVYFDTDLATDIDHLEELVESVRSEGYDVATGSRLGADREPTRPSQRSPPSRGFNAAVRFLLGSSLRDHQCGFKAFDREALFSLLDDVRDEHWFWDTEVLVRAQRRGYRVKELPVRWRSPEETKVHFVRDVLGMGTQVTRCWWEFTVAPRLTPRVTLAGGVLLVALAALLMTVYIDVGAVLAEMRAADPLLVALGTALYALSWPLRGGRYRDILSELGYDASLGFLTGAVFLSQTGNLVFPARAGDAIRAYVVKARRGVPYPSGFASLAVERVFDLLTITTLAGTVLLGLSLAGAADPSGLDGVPPAYRRSGEAALTVAAAVGVAALLAVWAIVLGARRDDSFVRRAFARVSTDSYAAAAAGVVESFVADVQRVAHDRRAFARIGASSLAIWTLDVVTALFVFAAFDVALSPTLFVAVGFFAVSVGNLAKVLPLSPGGVGLYEGAFTLLVVALTPVGFATALGAAIVDHAVKNAVTVAGGVVSTFALNVSLTTAVDETREVETAEMD